MLQNLAVWIILRLMSSLWAAVISSFRPLGTVERTWLLWPPKLLNPAWLDRVFFAPWSRWDAQWYLQIVTSGYSSRDGTLQFHPLFPWLASMLHWIGLHPLLALQMISSGAALALLMTFERLAILDISIQDSRQSVLILAFFPLSLILFAPYSESLFLLCSVLCFIAFRKHCWLAAGIAGLLASLTRQQGLFLMIPLAWEIWQASEHNWKRAIASLRPWSAPALTLVGYLLWVLIRRLYFSEISTAHQGLNGLIFTLLVSPSANQVVPQQAFLLPWEAFGLAVQHFIAHPDLDMIFNLLFSGIFLVLFVISWRSLRFSYRLYCIAIFLVSFCYYTGPIHPYMGLPRHLFLAFPVFIGCAPSLRLPSLRLAYAGAGLIGMLALLTGYVLEAWVP